MRIVVPFFLGLVTVSACESDRSLGADLRSGSRLRARYWVAPGGAEIFADWYDTELEVSCEPQQLANGSLHCVPNTATGAMVGTTGPGVQISVFYADAACSQHVHQHASQCGAIPTLVRRHESDTCGGHFVVHEVTGEADVQELFGVDPFSGECQSLGAPRPGAQYLLLGDELAPSAFVALQEADAGGSGRVRQRFYHGSDGSRLPRDLVDTELDVSCTPLADADGQLRCLPESINVYSWADPECQTQMARWVQADPECTVPDFTYGRQGELVACTIRSRIYSLGAPTPGVTPYVEYTEGTCEPNGLPPGAVGTQYGWNVDAELSPDTFVALEAQPPAGEGRLQVLTHQGPGALDFARVLWDSERGESCRPALMADGLTRCAPLFGAMVRDTFADPQCALGAPSVWYQFPDCMETEGGHYAVSTEDACPGGRRVFTVGEALDGSPLYEINSQGECQEAQLAGQYAVGAEIPASAFVEMTLEQR